MIGSYAASLRSRSKPERQAAIIDTETPAKSMTP
jgi:hypothetical protein